MQAGTGKIAWLVRSTRPDLAFKNVGIQQSMKKATVQTVLDFNLLVGDAKRDAHVSLTFRAMELEEMCVLGWTDAPFCNVGGEETTDGVNLASQAGYVGLHHKEQHAAQGRPDHHSQLDDAQAESECA